MIVVHPDGHSLANVRRVLSLARLHNTGPLAADCQPRGHLGAKCWRTITPRVVRSHNTERVADATAETLMASVAARAEACAGTARDGLATTDAKASTATNTRRTTGWATMRLPLTPYLTIGVAACDTATPPSASRSGRCSVPPTADQPRTWCGLINRPQGLGGESRPNGTLATSHVRD